MGRRSDGEGSIYQDKDGRWRGSVVLGWAPAPGTKRGVKPIRKLVSGTSRRAVAAKIRDLLEAQAEGQTVFTGVPTVAAWLEHWVEQVARPSVKDTTYQGYAVAVRRFQEVLGSRVKLDGLTAEHLEGVYAGMRDEGHAAGNIALHHRVMNRALTVARKRGRVRMNVAELVELPSGAPFRGKAMTKEQVWAYLDVVMERRQPARWLWAVLMGWRQSEVLGLTWDRVDLDEGTVRRELGLVRVRGKGLQLQTLKSRAGEHTLPLPPTLVQLLKEQRKRQRVERMALGPAWKGAALPVNGGPAEPVDLVFPRIHGQAMSREDDWADWHTILAEAGIPPMRLHDARHSAATFLAALGVHPRVTQHLLGHSDSSLAQQVYTHVPDEAARAALGRMDDLIQTRRRKAKKKARRAAGAAGGAEAPGSSSGSTSGAAGRRRVQGDATGTGG